MLTEVSSGKILNVDGITSLQWMSWALPLKIGSQIEQCQGQGQVLKHWVPRKLTL